MLINLLKNQYNVNISPLILKCFQSNISRNNSEGQFNHF